MDILEAHLHRRHEAAAGSITNSDVELLSTKFEALGKGRKAKTLWGSLLMALFWNIWFERNKRVFEDYKGVGVEELWDRVRHWAALWASVSVEFRDYNLSSIFRDLLAAVN
ncbi:hypothetical protein DVH24_012222 [Malus domestica]|uniref:Uncharacterized protein n=1 Tax=Malus domestica TaxID=3750 RepID=A0A498HM14_MALDO|nr:hypothetical protein DVH24_012222 [Malus domestica]